MPLIGFKKQFAEAVKSGVKSQSIRPIGNRKYKVGDTLFAYSGLRTKYCKKLGEFKITEVGNLYFFFEQDSLLFPVVNGNALHSTEREKFAKQDGFDSWMEMRDWFVKEYGIEGLAHEATFRVIRWTIP
jgi:hypothetical protein